MTNDVLDEKDLYFLPKLLGVQGYSLCIKQKDKVFKVERIAFDEKSILIMVDPEDYPNENRKIFESDVVSLSNKTELCVRAEDGSFKFSLMLSADFGQPKLEDFFKND